MVNGEGEAVYCKFHYKSDQGIQTFTRQEADKMAMEDPDYAIRDLYNAISEKKFPTWTMFIQVMSFKQAESWYFNPFDLTKVCIVGCLIFVVYIYQTSRSGPMMSFP